MRFLAGLGLVVGCSLIAVGCGDDGSSGGDGGSDGSGANAATSGTNSGGSGSGTASNGATTTGSGTASTGSAMPDCAINTDCPQGSICSAGVCVAGCAADQPCGNSLSCCSGQCVDTQSDLANCGSCGTTCVDRPNVPESCAMGQCGFGTCDAGYEDCDGNLGTNGCETAGTCLCVPGEVQACYQGPAGTDNVGTCQSGSRTCSSNGLGWGPCYNQVFPSDEVCADNLDNDCNGIVDDVQDKDGDGWTACDGDCCDEPGPNCANPALVNPGAFEYPGNQVDDDCDAGTPDTVAALCSTSQKFGGVTPSDVIGAIDLCQNTTVNAPLPQRKWGVVSSQWLLANGSTPSAAQLTNIQGLQSAVMTQYGTNATNVAQKGATFAGISSGTMRDSNDPGYVAPNGGSNFGSISVPPAGYLAAHANALPSSASCYGNCPAGSGANDSINLRAQIRVPTNAQSFSYKFRFFSSEFWQWSCTAYNDFYLALLTSNAPGIPADRNISFDSQNNPVSVNNGFFDVCNVRGCQTCPGGTAALAGTGLQTVVTTAGFGSGATGGATNWLTTTAPVVPGETITIEFMVFDVSDNILDSLTLLDAFEWSVTPSGVGTKE